jgi:hypothetical protein
LPKAPEGWEAFVVGSFYQAIRRNLARQLLQVGSWVTASALLALGCQASLNANVKTHVRQDAEQGPEDAPDFNKPSSAQALAAKSPPEAAPTEVTLLGARRDMSLVSANANAACACLKVAIGSSKSAAFRWQGSAPHLNDDTQLAFALSSEGMACTDEPKGSSGASYWGYRISGNDVIVFVEGARSNRPRAVAAIVPKPVADGQVYVAPAKAKFPYGRSLDGKGERCKVGNVPTKRSTPFAAGELGDTSLNHAESAPSVDAVE